MGLGSVGVGGEVRGLGQWGLEGRGGGWVSGGWRGSEGVGSVGVGGEVRGLGQWGVGGK